MMRVSPSSSSSSFLSRAALMTFATFAVASLAACSGAKPARAKDEAKPPVVLLHGLGLGAASMSKIAGALERDGRRVCAVDYPSRAHPIDTLVARFVAPAIRACFAGQGRDSGAVDAIPIDFVTHSMGGILVRALAARGDSLEPFSIGRVVMIAPPNRGSEVVDSMAGSWWFGGLLDAWGGPAGHELGTDANSAPRRLSRNAPPAFAFGVIAATRSLDPLFSAWIPGRDDGKVAVENTKLEGMKDFIEVSSTHTLILWDDETIRQVRAFLATGKFVHEPDRKSGTKLR